MISKKTIKDIFNTLKDKYNFSGEVVDFEDGVHRFRIQFGNIFSYELIAILLIKENEKRNVIIVGAETKDNFKRIADISFEIQPHDQVENISKILWKKLLLIKFMFGIILFPKFIIIFGITMSRLIIIFGTPIFKIIIYILASKGNSMPKLSKIKK